jgi:hypothetical protein
MGLDRRVLKDLQAKSIFDTTTWKWKDCPDLNTNTPKLESEFANSLIVWQGNMYARPMGVSDDDDPPMLWTAGIVQISSLAMKQIGSPTLHSSPMALIMIGDAYGVLVK